MENLLANLQDYFLVGLTILGALSAVSHALEPIVKLTKTEKDDALLAKLNLVLTKVQSVLTSLVSPKKSV